MSLPLHPLGVALVSRVVEEQVVTAAQRDPLQPSPGQLSNDRSVLSVQLKMLSDVPIVQENMASKSSGACTRVTSSSFCGRVLMIHPSKYRYSAHRGFLGSSSYRTRQMMTGSTASYTAVPVMRSWHKVISIFPRSRVVIVPPLADLHVSRVRA